MLVLCLYTQISLLFIRNIRAILLLELPKCLKLQRGAYILKKQKTENSGRVYIPSGHLKLWGSKFKHGFCQAWGGRWSRSPFYCVHQNTAGMQTAYVTPYFGLEASYVLKEVIVSVSSELHGNPMR